MNKVIIGVGSNINPNENIQLALEMIRRQMPILAESRFVVTKPIGDPKQPDFLNGAIMIETDLSPDELKKALQQIEKDLGKMNDEKAWGPRSIDMDIVVWNGAIVHPDVYERDFLQHAIHEISPDIKI